MPTFKRTVPSLRYGHVGAGVPARASLRDNTAMSFVMLTESQLAPTPGPVSGGARTRNFSDQKPSVPVDSASADTESLLSHKVETLTRLFEILSARSDIDHPICSECTELLVEKLQKRLTAATNERDAYVSFLRQANSDIPSEEERKHAEQVLRKMRNKESVALQELALLESQKAAMDEEIQSLDRESRDLEEEEEAFWGDRNAFTATLTAFRNEKDAMNARYDHDSNQLQRLQRTNVYNDTFCISHDGFFGTINGLRLGRLSNPPVDWPEINAAWGQTCLLLATVAEKLRFCFRGFRLNPMGSTSFIEKFDSLQDTAREPSRLPRSEKTQILELYCSGDLPLGLGFLHRRFDVAMVAFLECLRQLGEHVEHAPSSAAESLGHGLRMPYEIRKDKIHDTSIKFTFSQEESWTKACKYTLTCCKYLLAHASNVNSGGIGRSP